MVQIHPIAHVEAIMHQDALVAPIARLAHGRAYGGDVPCGRVRYACAHASSQPLSSSLAAGVIAPIVVMVTVYCGLNRSGSLSLYQI